MQPVLVKFERHRICLVFRNVKTLSRCKLEDNTEMFTNECVFLNMN